MRETRNSGFASTGTSRREGDEMLVKMGQGTENVQPTTRRRCKAAALLDAAPSCARVTGGPFETPIHSTEALFVVGHCVVAR